MNADDKEDKRRLVKKLLFYPRSS